MTFPTHCKPAKGPLDAVPLVNVVFLLLIFLVMSSPLVLQPGIGVLELQPSNTTTAASFQGLVVTVTRENLMFCNNQVTTLTNLRQSLRAAAQKFPRQELIIKADRQVSHGTVIQIMSLALDAGITAVNLATRPELSTPTTRK